ncbi:LuxR C-terminal-related transcriptional regulator [Thiomicrorhabdus sp.]|uniref:LuxR C-terminal-related transcriptional regulator n=1 Tax=Thiomicrorhabdus sp. TaxID=2039724 RepID=UPI0029C88309|nr:LuxR C-terminal-related transcriptional regulator [Thiomicrorhabdus sp.]
MDLLGKTNHLVRQLYRTAYSTPVEDFKDVCFDLVAELFQIDSGTWITRCEREIPFYEQDSFTYRLPAGFMEHYHHLATVSTQVHQVFGVMLGNLGKTLDILDVVPEEEWFGSDMYKLYCEAFNLHHSLMTVTVNPLNQAMNIVTFARHDPLRRFTEEEKQAKEFLVPNLIEAMRINILNSFRQGKGDNTAYRAVLDRYGNFIEAEEGFMNLLNEYQLIREQKLQLDLQADQLDYRIGPLRLSFQNYNGLLYTEVHMAPIEERLGERKLAICRCLLEGKSNKEIARELEIAPNTVNNHLKEIFKALNVSRRHQAIAYLMRQNSLLKTV